MAEAAAGKTDVVISRALPFGRGASVLVALVLSLGAGCDADGSDASPTRATPALDPPPTPTPAADGPDPREIVLAPDDVPGGLALVRGDSGPVEARDAFHGVRLPPRLRRSFEAGHRSTFERRAGRARMTYVASVALAFDDGRAATRALRVAERTRLARAAGVVSIQGRPLGEDARAWVLEEPMDRERVVGVAWRRGPVAMGLLVEGRRGIGPADVLALARLMDRRAA